MKESVGEFIAVSIHLLLSPLKAKIFIEVSFPIFRLFLVNPITYSISNKHINNNLREGLDTA